MFATGDACAVDAAVLCFKKYFAIACPRVQCVAYGVGVSGLPRMASVEVSLHVVRAAVLRPLQHREGARIYRACASSDIRLIVAFILDGESAVAELKAALDSVADGGDGCDVACTAWIAGAHQQQMAAALDADAGHNWSVLSAHSLCSEDSAQAIGGCAAVLSIARHDAQP